MLSPTLSGECTVDWRRRMVSRWKTLSNKLLAAELARDLELSPGIELLLSLHALAFLRRLVAQHSFMLSILLLWSAKLTAPQRPQFARSACLRRLLQVFCRCFRCPATVLFNSSPVVVMDPTPSQRVSLAIAEAMGYQGHMLYLVQVTELESRPPSGS